VEVGSEAVHARAQAGVEGEHGGLGFRFDDQRGVDRLVLGALGAEYRREAAAWFAGRCDVVGGGVTYRGWQRQRQPDLLEVAMLVGAGEDEGPGRASAPATPTTTASTMIFWRILRLPPVRPDR
jgi:hypothetical protein